MKNRIELFGELISGLDSLKSEKEGYKYLGTGNPNADILIIGKETSIHSNQDQVIREIDNNLQDWKKILKNKKFSTPNWDGTNYSPLYPYKGQVYKIQNRKTGYNGGTSYTWYNYQKLINLIYSLNSNENIDFHEKVFISEVNSTPSLKTKDADTSSISFRKEHILRSEFIKSFPIVIVSGVGYFNISDSYNEIEDIFEVNFEKQKFAGGKKNQPYWIHRGLSDDKLLINTWQLSIGVGNDLLNEISAALKESELLQA